MSQEPSARTTSDAALAELRGPLAGTDVLHLNNAGVGPMCARAHGAGQRALARMLEGSVGIPAALTDYEAARDVFARFVGAAREDVTFFQTCAAAISQAAGGIPLAAGDEIVISDEEYPSNAYPWYRAAERAGAVVRAVPVGEVALAIGDKTRVVAVSWVQYSTGNNVDVRALADKLHGSSSGTGARGRGARKWMVVDAIQGLGVMPFDLTDSGADVIMGGTQKWCLGPVGHGFMACAPGVADEMQPIMHGAMTYGSADDVSDPARPARRTDPRRFEPGSPLLLGAIAGAGAIEALLDVGITRVNAEAMALRALVVDGAAKRGVRVVQQRGPLASPIVTLLPNKREPKHLVDALRARKCSTAPRGGGVRVAPHVHNGPQHIDAFFALWDELDR